MMCAIDSNVKEQDNFPVLLMSGSGRPLPNKSTPNTLKLLVTE